MSIRVVFKPVVTYNNYIKNNNVVIEVYYVRYQYFGGACLLCKT